MKEFKVRAWSSLEHKMFYNCLHVLSECDGKNTNVLTFMQFFYLKDKNGKDIYEGDIIKGIYDRKIAYWQANELTPYGATFIRIFPENAFRYNTSVFFINMLHRDQWEVIGNIYENVEFLKGIKQNG